MGLVAWLSKWGKMQILRNPEFTVHHHLNSGKDRLVEICEDLSEESSAHDLQAKTQEFIAYKSSLSRQVLSARDSEHAFVK